MMIEIKGVQFENKGAELMLLAIVKMLKHEFIEVELCLHHNINSPYEKRATLGAYQKVNLKKNIFDLNFLFYFIPTSIRRFFKNRFGIVSEADVDVVLDASGFSYGDQWSDLILRQTAQEIVRLKKQGKIYIFLPQSLGPFTRENNRKYAKIAFENADLVFARELPSYENISSLIDSKNNLHRAPDFTNLIEPSQNVDWGKYKDHIVFIPNSKMLSNKNKRTWWRDNYVSTFTKLAQRALAHGERVVILNHSGKDDIALCNDIREQLPAGVDIISIQSALGVKSIINRAKLVICSRFHGCVSALSQGVPCIATGWSHKYKELFMEYQSGQLLLNENISDRELYALFDECLAKRSELSSVLHEPGLSYKNQTKEMWSKVIGIIKHKYNLPVLAGSKDK